MFADVGVLLVKTVSISLAAVRCSFGGSYFELFHSFIIQWKFVSHFIFCFSWLQSASKKLINHSRSFWANQTISNRPSNQRICLFLSDMRQFCRGPVQFFILNIFEQNLFPINWIRLMPLMLLMLPAVCVCVSVFRLWQRIIWSDPVLCPPIKLKLNQNQSINWRQMFKLKFFN